MDIIEEAKKEAERHKELGKNMQRAVEEGNLDLLKQMYSEDKLMFLEETKVTNLGFT